MWIDDDILERCAEPLAVSCFLPKDPMVVLGASNVAATEADEGACAKAGVPVVRRYGGGGAVVLYRGSVVVSLGAWVRQHFQNKFYFQKVNQSVITALVSAWPALEVLGQNGLSDITAGDRKVAGTSLFRSRNYLLYQASLLVDLDAGLIKRYLKHPSKEPDYRANREHGTFLTSIGALAGATPEQVLAQLHVALASSLIAELGDELVAPDPAQFEGLLNRAAGGRRDASAAIPS